MGPYPPTPPEGNSYLASAALLVVNMHDGTWAVRDLGPDYQGDGPFLATGFANEDQADLAARQMIGNARLPRNNANRIAALERAVFGNGPRTETMKGV